MVRAARGLLSPVPPGPARRTASYRRMGQRHLRYLRQHRKALYTELQITGKLNGYLADLNEQAENMFLELVKQMAAWENVTEQLMAQNQMLWVQRMNNIRDRAVEVVNNDLIYA